MLDSRGRTRGHRLRACVVQGVWWGSTAAMQAGSEVVYLLGTAENQAENQKGGAESHQGGGQVRTDFERVKVDKAKVGTVMRRGGKIGKRRRPVRVLLVSLACPQSRLR